MLVRFFLFACSFHFDVVDFGGGGVVVVLVMFFFL